MRNLLETDLNYLRDHVLLMGGEVEGAIDRATGNVVWNRQAHTGVPRVKRHVKASHASATPATNGRVIVALLGSEGLFCFDMNGTQKWRQDLGPRVER